MFRNLIRDCAGTAVVEFALVALIYFPLLFGVVEFARYAAIRQDLMHAVSLVGRYAIVHGLDSTSPATSVSLQTMVGSKLILLPSSAVLVNANFSPNNKRGSTVTITATYDWTPIVSMLPLPSATISATSAATILN